MSTSINPHLDLKPDPKAVELFTEFFSAYYHQQIQSYPDLPGSSIEVDFQDIKEFDDAYDYDDDQRPLHQNITDSPVDALHYAETALQEYDDSIPGLSNAAIRLTNHDNRLSIRDIRKEDVNRLVTIEGIVSKATEVDPRTSKAKFKCRYCGTRMDVPQPTEEREEPFQCTNEDCGTTNGRAFQMLPERSQIVNYQKVQVQESPDDLKGGQTPQSIDIALHGDATGEVTPGERVTVTGVMKAKDTKNSSVLRLYLQGNNITQEEQEFEELVVSEEEEKKIKKLAEDPQVYKKLRQSLAPTIKGHDIQKLAGVFQLFGGVRKSLPDGSQIRGDIHVLYVGDPGTGKSQILRYVDKLSPRGIYTSGKGSSAAGLTAAAVKDPEFNNDQFTLEAGAMVLADKGIACVDELDKMADSDRSAMHEALEQQSVSVSKAGINATLKSRCSLLGAANPEHGRWDEHKPIPQQINLEPALVSRFDLIFTIEDKPDEDKDTMIAEHILGSNRTGQRVAAGKDVNRTDDVVGEVPVDLFRKYVAYARKNIQPEMTDEAEKKLRDFYVDLRTGEDGDNDAIPVTARKLEALVRLAEAAARIRLSDTATVEDANKAIMLAEKSMQQVGLDPETGEFDMDMLETGQSKSQRDRVTSVLDAIEALCAQDEDGLASKTEIVVMLEGNGISESKVEKTLQKLGEKGEIYSPPHADQDEYALA